MITQCEWVKDDSTRCGGKPEEGRSLCSAHIKQQQRIAELSMKNAKFFDNGEARPESIQCSGMDRLEAATEEEGSGAMHIFNRDTKLSYKWVRDRPMNHSMSQVRGWRFVEEASPESTTRPIAGQSENSKKNHGMTMKNQVGSDGRIRVGDAVLMAMPKNQRSEKIARSVQHSKGFVNGVISPSSRRREASVEGSKYETFQMQGNIKRDTQELGPVGYNPTVQSTRKSVLIENNPLAR